MKMLCTQYFSSIIVLEKKGKVLKVYTFGPQFGTKSRLCRAMNPLATKKNTLCNDFFLLGET